jgi:chromosome partitioning protein
MRSIAVVNQKGGCGKTITAINLAAFLAREQRRILLIDMDPQGHSTLGLLVSFAHPDKTISDVLLAGLSGEVTPLCDVTRTVLPNLDLIPADILLSAVPERLATVYGRERTLAKALEGVRNHYDYVIVDCPPSVGLLTFNALLACSEAIIPLDPSFFSLHGVGKLLETLEMLVKKAGHRIDARALITLYPGRSEFVKEVVEDIRKHLAERVFNTIIRFSVKLAEAASHGLPISEYCKHSAGYEDYQMLANEIMQYEAEWPVRKSSKEDKGQPKADEGLLKELPAPSGPMPTGDGVVFTLRAPEAHSVQLAGDFNGWVPDGNEMQCCGGVWRKVLALMPGRYQYRYVVDGHWQSDPMNCHLEPSPYGDYNSVIVLDK